MTSAKLSVSTTKDNQIQFYIDKINKELQNSNDSWWNIATVLKEAQNEFGRGSRMMKRLIAKAGFTDTKADKLVAIANCDRLKKNWKLFANVSAWTVLYQTTLLDAIEFGELTSLVKEGNRCTVKLIQQIRNQSKKGRSTRTMRPGDRFIPFLTVKIREKDLVLGNVDLQEIEEAFDLTLGDDTESNIIELAFNENAEYLAQKKEYDTYEQMNQIMHDTLKKEIDAYLQRIKTLKGKNAMEKARLDFAEIGKKYSTDLDYESLFELADSDKYNLRSFEDAAHEKVNKLYEKLYA